MSRIKYKFNKDSLSYEKVSKSLIKNFLNGIRHLTGSVIMALILLLAYFAFFDTPSDRNLREENKKMAEDLAAINDSLTNFHDNLQSLASQDNNIYRTIYQLDSIPMKIRNSGFGGANKYQNYSGHEYSDIVIEIQKNLDQINRKLAVQENSFLEIGKALEEESLRMKCTPAITPIHNDNIIRFGTDYGYRRNPITGHTHFHKGVDHTASFGTPVYASGNGVIEFANYRPNGYGKHIIIDHGVDGLSSLYAHLQTIQVRDGEQVVRGQQIGTIGSTGLSLGPHLHYEVHVNGQHVNPKNYQITLTSSQYDELLEQAQQNIKSKFLAKK
ncbi:MAG: M23 family metallopeptidase [Bacteroidota bacterium]|nr:M23 family metallopeptidase [Bacteroidota bacterium]